MVIYVLRPCSTAAGEEKKDELKSPKLSDYRLKREMMFMGNWLSGKTDKELEE